MKNPVECPRFKIDQACVTVDSYINEKLSFLWQSEECLNCDLSVIGDPITFRREASFNLDTRFGSRLQLESLDNFQNQSCQLRYHFIENGRYLLTATKNSSDCDSSVDNCLKCELTVTSVASLLDAYLPIIYAAVGYFALALFWILLKTFHKRGYFSNLFRRRSQDLSTATLALDNNQSGNVADSNVTLQNERTPAVPVKKRLKSLDTFRGVAITVMIFVNYGGGKYYFFDHLPWNGLSVADLVFPWFIWIMGVSMAISSRSLVRRMVPKKKIFFKIVKRSCILFALGIILNTSYGANDLSKIRIPGVLQRFAICYLVVASLHVFYANIDTTRERRMFWLRDITLYWVEWLIVLVLLVTHIVITFAINEPGCPKGYLGPGGLHDHGNYFNCTGGASGYIDRWFFTKNHMYNHPTPKEIYRTSQPYDPEGILGSLTSIFLVFMGLQAGKILMIYSTYKGRLIRWLLWGLFMGIIALILCNASKNDGWIPVNKNLWSVSYIMATGSMAFFLLSFCYYVQDVKNWWSGAPFFYPGMNSILLYVGHQLTGELFPWTWAVATSHGAFLGVNLWGCSLWVFISYVLYRKKIFLAI